MAVQFTTHQVSEDKCIVRSPFHGTDAAVVSRTPVGTWHAHILMTRYFIGLAFADRWTLDECLRDIKEWGDDKMTEV